MKRILLIGLVCCLCFTAQAQLQKGTKYLGGTVSFNGTTSESHLVNQKSDSQGSNQHTIIPELQFGYFVNSTTMIGLGLQYNLLWYNTRSSLPEVKNTSVLQSWQLSPFIRKYKTFGNRWAVFLHGEVGPSYQLDKYKIKGDNPYESKGDYWKYRLSVKPGIVYTFPKKTWAVEAYANVLSLDFTYLPVTSGTSSARQIILTSGLSTSFPTYFTLRIAKYIPSKAN